MISPPLRSPMDSRLWDQTNQTEVWFVHRDSLLLIHGRMLEKSVVNAHNNEQIPVDTDLAALLSC